MENPDLEIMLAHPGHVRAVALGAQRVRELADGGLDMLRGERGERYGGYRVERRSALIPVIGPLIPRGPVGLARCGVTSYEGLRDELRQAAADDAVDTIIMMIDSPGGMVTGIDATADAVLAARRAKPVVAVVEGMAASAAYWLAASADRIVLAPFGEVGSIGAIAVHIEASRALDAAGITVTVMRAGARKAEGNPFEPLGDEAQADLQASLDKVRVAFAGAVAAGRPRLSLDEALATEARVFDADEAMAIGLVDSIGTLDGLIAAMPPATSLRRPVPAAIAAPLVLPSSSDLVQQGVGPAPPLEAIPGLGAPPARLEVVEQGEDRKRLAAALKQRASALFGHPFVAQQQSGRLLADHLFESDQPLDQALQVLDAMAAICEESAKAPALTLDQEMAADAQPLLGSDGGGRVPQLSKMEEGAVAAARALGKDPAVVLATMRGHAAPTPGAPAPGARESAVADQAAAAVSMGWKGL